MAMTLQALMNLAKIDNTYRELEQCGIFEPELPIARLEQVQYILWLWSAAHDPANV